METQTRLQKHRAAKREAGYTLKQIWVLPSLWPRIKAAIARIQK